MPQQPEPIRVLVVDDSALMRKALSGFITSDARLQLVGTAFNGREGLEKVALLKPDVVTMDIEMPVLDGLSALRELRRVHPGRSPAVLMCSSLTVEGSRAAFDALRLGAADVIAKDPSEVGKGHAGFRAELIEKLVAISPRPAATPRALERPATSAAPGKAVAGTIPRLSGVELELVAIGSSTGGPPVLEKLIASLPAGFRLPIVVAQHMPAMFTRTLAERLNELCAVRVVLAQHGMPVLPGTVYISEGGHQTRVERAGGRLRITCSTEPANALYKPSVNELFESIASACGPATLALMLTGMGDDGAIGAERLTRAGGRLVAQEASSCVVYGMPRAVVDRGLALAAISPTQMVELLASLALSPARLTA